MENSSEASELLWDEQQRAIKAQADIEHRKWLRNFVLLFALVALTVAVAMLLAGSSAARTVRL